VTSSFDTGTGAADIHIGGDPADTNVAVSSTHVCVTARAAFAGYTKAGAIVSLGAGFQARPYTAVEFFTESFKQSNLNYTIAPTPPTGTPTKDGRVVFDQIRKRFFMAFQSEEEHPHLLIAVSKSEDPSDGWWTYFDDVLEAGVATGQDYMSLGISADYFLISNRMALMTGTYPNPPDPNHPWTGVSPITRHFMYSATELAAGNQSYKRIEWSNPAARGAAACVNNDNSNTTDAFWVTRDDATHATVWGVRNGAVPATSHQVAIQTSSGPPGNAPQLGGGTVDYGHIIFWQPQNVEYRDGRIVFVSNDGHTWEGQSTPNCAIRLVRLNVSKFFDPSPSVTVEIDRILGGASVSDPVGQPFDYGWPAVSTNSYGDIVIGSVRSNATIYPELRASVWFHTESDMSSSLLVAASSSPLTEYHMAGACADPSSDGVYIAQAYGSGSASSPDWRIRVAKILGMGP